MKKRWNIEHQLEAVKASLLFTSPSSLTTALSAARKVGLSANRIVLLVPPSPSGSHDSKNAPRINLVTVNELIYDGLREPGPALFQEKKLSKGDNQKKVAFLSFSSGTTGKPKVSRRRDDTVQFTTAHRRCPGSHLRH
ncbi:hypothetical protein FRB94_006903 [Tulasnella sp. JGI-2019a]|nr:hypothetical protein FRB94_006903 [Tulasnella sp. JGI-2019a]